MQLKLVGIGSAEGVGDELRPKRGAPDSDDKAVLERSGSARQLAGMHLASELVDILQASIDRLADGCIRSERAVPQPVVTDHPVFIRIGDGPALQSFHGGVGLLDLGLHPAQKAVVEIDPADIECEVQLRQL